MQTTGRSTAVRRTLAITLALLGPAAFAATSAEEQPWGFWRPIEPELLAAKTPSVDKDADAEAVFWKVWVEDELLGGEEPRSVLKHYLRIKLFNARGVESQSHVDLTYGKQTDVSDIAGRTLKPDGTIVELKKSDVFERTVLKADGVKWKTRSFVLPGAEVGAVIEYRWREFRRDQLADHVRLQLQRDIPVQQVAYVLRPFEHPMVPYDMRLQAFQIDFTRATTTKLNNGFTRVSFERLPAYKSEPRMPPESVIRAWLLVYYTPISNLSEDKFWRERGKEIFKFTKALMPVDDDVQAATNEAVAGATSAAERVARIHTYCRARIKRLDDDASGLSAEERAKVKHSRSPGDTLRRGAGIGRDVSLLFGAMASAAGLEVRIGRLGDRGDFFFDQHFLDDYFLSDGLVAVKLDGAWRFFDPASTYVPFGMLQWTNEGVPALVSDAQNPTFVDTPISAPDKSRATRKGTFTLNEDGTLEGDVRIEYTGHMAAALKERNDGLSAEEREKGVRENVQKRLSAAELSDIALENVTDPEKPFVESYKLRVPGYGQRTGRRLFFQPAFFQHGRTPEFPDTQRVHPVYFEYPWSEEDSVSIALPSGFFLENAESPAPIAAGDAADHRVKMTIKGSQFSYERHFFFGGGGRIMLPVDAYPLLKQLFDAVHAADGHTLTVRQAGP